MNAVMHALSSLYAKEQDAGTASIHVARIDRALTSREGLYERPDVEAVKHLVSRLSVFARGLTAALENNESSTNDAVTALNYLSHACDEIDRILAAEATFDEAREYHYDFTGINGRTCLDRVEERDIDLLLLEEINAEQNLQRLIRSLTLAENPEAVFRQVSNSVTTVSGGESDLIAVYRVQEETVAVLIENKISASFMPQQAARYHRRGQSGIVDGLWDRYVTCLCAPQCYIDANHGEHQFDRYVSYEQLAEHFRRKAVDKRGAWRFAMIRQAIQGGKRSNYVRVPDEATSSFFREYYQRANTLYPSLRMAREKDRPATSTWVKFNPHVSLPKRYSLWHKARYGTVDLEVTHCRVEDLHLVTKGILDHDMRVEQTGKSAVVRIESPIIDASAPIREQLANIDAALSAAQRLAKLMHDHSQSLLSIP